MSTLPNTLGTGMITGRFIYAVIDGSDPDREPEVLPCSGEIEFVASIGYVPIPETSEGPVTMFKPNMTGILDDEGYLCTPDPETGLPMYRGVRLVAADGVGLLVKNWTYKVLYRIRGDRKALKGLPAHDVTVLTGSEEDLTKIVKVPSSPGVGIPQIEAAARRMEAVSITTSEADALITRAEVAADRAEAPTDLMNKGLIADGASLTSKELNLNFASKTTQETVETGRLSPTALSAAIGSAVDAQLAEMQDQIDSLRLTSEMPLAARGIHPWLGGDSFSRPDGESLGTADSGQAWEPSAGTFCILGKSAATTLEENTRATIDTATIDHAAFVRLSRVPSTPAELWLIARFQDSATYYRFGFDVEGNLVLANVTAGESTVLRNYFKSHGVQAAGMDLGIACSGTNIRLFCNGRLVDSLTDSNNLEGTGVGLQCVSADVRFRNFRFRE